MHPRGFLRTHHSSARRLAVALTGLALTLGALPALTGAIPGTTAVTARADDLTASQDLLRTGWDPNETVAQMGPSAVAHFTRRFSVAVSGQVYAQPLVIDSLHMVVVATENDWVYGLDASTGTVIWSRHLGSPFVPGHVSKLAKCTDLVPNVGVTGTPAVDPRTGDVYMFAVIMSGSSPHYHLIGIDPSLAAKGKVIQNTVIGGHPSNNSSIAFSATFQMERPGVLVTGGGVWGAFASHCDKKPYSGYVARFDLASKKVSLWTDEAGVSVGQGGIWMGGGGIMSDTRGRIFLTSGNGISPGKASKPPAQLAESVIRLAYSSTTKRIWAADFFSPANAPKLDAGDTDFGAGGPVGLPFGTTNTAGTAKYPAVLAAPGKDGRIFLLNRGRLGGREQGGGNTDADLSVIRTAGGEWGHPAVFADTTTLTPGNVKTANNFLFYVGKDAHMQVFKFGVASSGKPTLSDVANSSLTYGYTSGSPVVTSAGTAATSVVIWEVYTPNTVGKTGAGAELEAYSLGPVASNGVTPSTCTSKSPCRLHHIANWPIGHSAKFAIPATSRGWVYVGTRDGHVLGFAAPGTTAPVVGAAANFAPTKVGTTTSRTVSITAQHAVTITGDSASAGASNAATPATQFTVGQVTLLKKGSKKPPVPVILPVTLAKGDKLSAKVTFKPAAPGGTDGTLSFTTGSTAFHTVNVAIAGQGTQGGLYPEPSQMSFPLAPDQGVTDVPVGIMKPELINITNFGTATQTVTSVTPPSAPFIASGLPSVGATIKPGETITVQVTFAPSSAGSYTSSFTIAGSGSPATVQLSGTATAAVSQFTTPAPVVSFGTVKVGKKATRYIRISNTGNTASLVKRASAMPSPFAAPLKPPPGMPFNPDSDMAVPVNFTPARKGTFTTHYRLTWTDVNGTHTLTVTLTGTAV